MAKRLENLVGSNPTPEKVLESVTKLSDEEVDILAEGADSNWPLDTDKQKAEFEIGCGQTLSSNDGKSYMQEESVDTTQATISIRNLFTRLHGKISRIDQVHHANFGPEIVRLQNVGYPFYLSLSVFYAPFAIPALLTPEIIDLSFNLSGKSRLCDQN